jgi:hypothetical protein
MKEVPPIKQEFVSRSGVKRGPFTEEHRRKLSEARRKRVVTDETRKKISKSRQTLGLVVKLNLTKEKIADMKQLRRVDAIKKYNLSSSQITKIRKGAYDDIAL